MIPKLVTVTILVATVQKTGTRTMEMIYLEHCVVSVFIICMYSMMYVYRVFQKHPTILQNYHARCTKDGTLIDVIILQKA